jgi:hypothetical protein
MLLEKQDMSHSNPPFLQNAEQLPLKRTKGGGLLRGKAAELETKRGIYKFGCPNTLMQRWAGVKAIFMNTGWLCQKASAGLLKAMSLFTIRMASRMIIALKILSCLPSKFIEGKWFVLTVERSLR